MGTGQEVDDDGLIKSLLRCHEYKRRARKQVFHNKTFYKHIMKVHIMRQDIRKEIDSIQQQQHIEEQLREERRKLELQQEQQQIEYQRQLEFQQYQNQLAFEQQQQQQQQEFTFQQQQLQNSGYQIAQNQMPHQMTGYQDQYQFQYQQVEPQQQFQAQQDYQTPMNYMQYSHDYGYEETSVKFEHRISSLESLETPPPSDLPSHPPPSLSSISSSSFTDSTTATLSSMYNLFAPTETPTTSSADQASIRGSRTSSGFGSSAGSSQSPKNVCSPSNQLTLKFSMQLPQSAAADVDIMRRNLWLMIVRKEIPQARKRKMSFKDQKRAKAKTAAHRCVGHLKEFRRRLAIKAEKMNKLQAIVNEVQQDRVETGLV